MEENRGERIRYYELLKEAHKPEEFSKNSLRMLDKVRL